jgi:hypothetical protein
LIRIKAQDPDETMIKGPSQGRSLVKSSPANLRRDPCAELDGKLDAALQDRFPASEPSSDLAPASMLRQVRELVLPNRARK